MKYIVNVEWLYQHLNDPNVRIIDCRFNLANPQEGREMYTRDHIPGAIYFDLDQDLSGSIGPHGGRHPLPNPDEFVAKLSKSGIDENTKVVAYDDQGGAFASRFWWLMKYMGHQEVYILDGGYKAWKEKGYPITDEVVNPLAKTFVPNLQTHLLVSMHDVKERIDKKGSLLIDSREHKRYLGLEEPIDRKAGHIPGAINHFWKEGLDDQGYWKREDEQRERFSEIDRDQEIIVYCGSGVTACPNVLALLEAGFENVKLYAGSWSDWISYEDNPIAKGSEK